MRQIRRHPLKRFRVRQIIGLLISKKKIITLLLGLQKYGRDLIIVFELDTKYIIF